MQKNQNYARYGAFSYVGVNFLDQREGGLMREALKNIGGLSFIGNNQSQTNTAPEIDPTTGIFIYDPDGLYSQAPKSASTPAPIYELAQQGWSNSGVINYLNQFGYKSIANLHRPSDNGLGGWHYIQFDNDAELYYETLRYLSLSYNGSSKTATPEYTKNLQTGQPFSSTVNDGFPLLTTYTDPQLDKCQSNYVVFLSDANTNCDGRIPGGVFYSESGTDGAHGQCANAYTTPSNPIANLWVYDWITWIEYFESGYSDIDWNATNLMNCPGGARGCYAGHSGPNIIGLAYWSHISDIRPDLDGFQNVTSFFLDVHEDIYRSQADVAPHAFGQDQTNLWFAAKYGGFTYNDSTSWDWNPNDDSTTWDSDGDGVPDTFLKGDSANMQSGLNSIFAKLVTNRTRNSNGHIALSVASTPTNTQSYKAYYANPAFGQWEGNLVKSTPTVSTTGGSQLTYSVGSAVGFDQGAAGWLVNDKIGTAARQIITAVRSAAGAQTTGAAFQWGSLGTYTQGLLKAVGETNATATSRLNYIRGDRSNEISTSHPNGFRTRPVTVLGDIVDSSPVFVGPAQFGYSDSDFASGTASYATFSQNSMNRTPMVYVGANDGMLHGFDASTLKEVFAFIPNSVINNLISFSSTSYVHNYFVDETPIVAEVPVSGRGWTTQLIGFPGMGGTGLFALDVTSPTNTNTNLSQAEANASNIVLWELNSQTDSDVGYILNRGQINRQRAWTSMQIGKMSTNRWAIIAGNGYNSANNSTGLLVVYLDSTGGGTPSYQKVMIQGATGGLSTPTPVDTNFDGKIDYVYAGDLQGNLWRFDVRNTDPTQWSAFKLFTAIDTWWDTNLPQPISTAPAIMNACSGQGLMVLFGTGKYLENSDNSVNQSQGMYGLWDKLDTTAISGSDLVDQYYLSWWEFNPSAMNSLTESAIITSNNTVDWSTKRGWRWNSAGDAIVAPPYVKDNNVFFTTIVPMESDACTFSGIWNALFALNACTGQHPSQNVFDLNFDGLINSSDQVNYNGTQTIASGVNSDGWDLQDNTLDAAIWISPKALTCTTPPCPISQTAYSGDIGISLTNTPSKRLSWKELRQPYQ